MIKPNKLQKGDTIGIIAPSGGLAKFAPHRLDNAIKFLNSQGYKIKEFPCSRKNNGHESAPAKERAAEIMAAFTDKEVKAIICLIGGSTANKTLEYLDFNKIRKNPKIFSGYSDISILHYALNKKSELVTFYGPCIMTQFGENPRPLEYTLKQFYSAVASSDPIGKINASDNYTDEVLNWFDKSDTKRPRKLEDNLGYEWLRKGNASGKLIGDCLPSILHLAGTDYWPKYKNNLLFLELPEGQDFREGTPLDCADAMLADLRNLGVFGNISGLVFGRPFKYSKEDFEKLKEVILDNTRDYSFPILYNANIGHADPIITIPIGVKAKLDSSKNYFGIIESGVK